jgi:hypothetical protein
MIDGIRFDQVRTQRENNSAVILLRATGAAGTI